ncbi:MAG: hypothetical protein LBI47_00255 [Puniceicoccales bacterium]|jgi:hypothetical protein|nr:hypothetical protein [Puniceicoccales bacterium]
MVGATGFETAAPKQSFWEGVRRFLEPGLTNLGDFVAGEEPIILPTGKDYSLGDRIQQEAALMEGKLIASAVSLVPPINVKKASGVGKMIIGGAKAVMAKVRESNPPGGLTLATPNGATVTGALEVAPAAVGVAEGIGVETITTAITGSDLPLSFDRQIGESGKYRDTEGQNKADTSDPYRTEIGKDIADYMNILKKDDLWTPEVRESLMKGLDDFKVEFPELFKKIVK